MELIPTRSVARSLSRPKRANRSPSTGLASLAMSRLRQPAAAVESRRDLEPLFRTQIGQNRQPSLILCAKPVQVQEGTELIGRICSPVPESPLIPWMTVRSFAKVQGADSASDREPIVLDWSSCRSRSSENCL